MFSSTKPVALGGASLSSARRQIVQPEMRKTVIKRASVPPMQKETSELSAGFLNELSALQPQSMSHDEAALAATSLQAELKKSVATVLNDINQEWFSSGNILSPTQEKEKINASVRDVLNKQNLTADDNKISDIAEKARILIRTELKADIEKIG